MRAAASRSLLSLYHQVEARAVKFLLKWGVGNGVGGGARSQVRVDASYFAFLYANLIVYTPG